MSTPYEVSEEQRDVLLWGECQGSGKIVQKYAAKREIAEDRCQSLGIVPGHQIVVCVLIVLKGFRKPVLALINIPNIDFQTGQAPFVSLFGKNGSRTFTCR